MNLIKSFVVAACLLAPLAIEAMLTKCSDEADAKGLFVKSGKGAARKAFRRECMAKMGVVPK